MRESRSPVTTEEVGESLLRKMDDPRTIHGIEGTTTRATSAPDSDECVRVFCISPVRSKETDFAPSRGHEKNASWLFLRSWYQASFPLETAHRFFLNAKLAYAHKQL